MNREAQISSPIESKQLEYKRFSEKRKLPKKFITIAEEAFDSVQPKIDEIGLVLEKHKNDFMERKTYTQDWKA